MTSTLHPETATARTWRHDVFGLAGRAGGIGARGAVREGVAPALHTAEGVVSYDDLAGRVRDLAEVLGTTRRLVLLEARNDVDSVVGYLAALAGGHAVLLVPPRETADPSRLVATYDPDVLLRDGGVEERRTGTVHDLHPDLAVLLSTSGTTGSPKLVRLSRDNLASNAAAIAEYLDIGRDDRAVTALPLHYCYGLSVLNSHLAAGASVVLTDLSVVDPCFWDLAQRAGVTSLAGVPHTFELLEASGFTDRRLPSLRYLTQAGGRMEPDRVARWAALGRERGWDLVVMYGQTEATARMAYLPPHLTLEYPGAIGCAVPGGCLRLERTEAGGDHGDHGDHGDDVGELVYEGPNVMLGYALAPVDLAKGPEHTILRTGDLARRNAAGLFEVVGRRDRVRKIYGLRVDLDHVEQLMGEVGLATRCLLHDDTLWVFLTRRRHRDRALARVLAVTGLPRHAIRVHYVDQWPVTPNGKPDYRALQSHAALLAAAAPSGTASTDTPADAPADAPVSGAPGRATAEAVRDLYAALLGRPDATVADSFVDLGGDSLSYVEASVRLGDLLGWLPSDWHQRTPATLTTTETTPATRTRARHPRRRRGIGVESSVLLRAAAIVLIVASHADLIAVMGGAHLLLAVAGYNFARFRLRAEGRRRRVRGALTSLLPVVVPTVLWVGLVALVTGTYRVETALLLNGLLGRDEWTVQWQLWFLEALVWTVVAVAGLLAVPWVDRLERRRPFALAALLLGAALAVRYAWVGVEAGATERYTVGIVAWCFFLGWAAAVASGRAERAAVAVAGLVATWGFFGDLQRELIVAGGLLALLYARPVVLPRRVAGLVSVLASASLYVYLIHWQVYPGLEAAGHPVLAVLASFAAGVLAWRAVRVITPGSPGPVATAATVVAGRGRACVGSPESGSRPPSTS